MTHFDRKKNIYECMLKFVDESSFTLYRYNKVIGTSLCILNLVTLLFFRIVKKCSDFQLEMVSKEITELLRRLKLFS
jgi:hypothetical protein